MLAPDPPTGESQAQHGAEIRPPKRARRQPGPQAGEQRDRHVEPSPLGPRGPVFILCLPVHIQRRGRPAAVTLQSMSSLNPRHAVFTGSFDPPTLGHVDLVSRGLERFERLTVAIGAHPTKPGLFSPEERVALFQELFKGHANLDVRVFSGLAVDFCRSVEAGAILRGLRSGSDFDYEAQMAATNRAMEPRIDTLFLAASPEVHHISSTLVRQIASMGGDVSSLVPLDLVAKIAARFSKKS